MSSSGRSRIVEAGPSAQRLGFALFRIGLEVARTYEKELAPLGLRHEHAGVLLAVGYDGPMHIRALGRHLGANRQTIVNTVDALETNGAVERTSDPTDARVVVVRLTKKGQSLLRKVEGASARMDARLAHVGTQTQRRDVLRFLHALADSTALGEPIQLAPARQRRPPSDQT